MKESDPIEPSSKSTLLSNYQAIKQKPDIEPPVGDFSPVFADQKYREHCFEETKKAFLLAFDKERIDEYLKAEPNEEAFRHLKKIRRLGVMLRSVYSAFDVSHRCPKDFSKFLKDLGGYNDKYWLPQKERSSLNEVPEVVGMDLSVHIAENSDYKEFINYILNEIDVSLNKKVLSVEEFHKLRVKIRLCADSMQISAAENLGGNMHWLAASLLELSVQFGDEHDTYVQKNLRREADYESVEVTVDSLVKKRIWGLEPYLKKVAGLAE